MTEAVGKTGENTTSAAATAAGLRPRKLVREGLRPQYDASTEPYIVTRRPLNQGHQHATRCVARMEGGTEGSCTGATMPARPNFQVRAISLDDSHAI